MSRTRQATPPDLSVRRRVLQGVQVAGSRSLDAAFRAAASCCPEATALSFDRRSYSYAWLEETSGRLAGAMREAGVRPGDVVGLHLERSPEMLAAMLATFRAGAAYLPLDPDFPPDRLALIAEDAGPALVLEEASTRAGLRAPAPTMDLHAALAAGAPAGEPAEVGPQDLAYVLYTSGSTGRPKGVEITHGAVLNLLQSFRDDTGFSSEDRMLASTTTAFDISVLELFLPLVACGAVVLAGSRELKDPQALITLLEREGCTFAQATPSKWRYLMEAGWRGGAELTLLCGGEALSRELADLLLARARRVWNVYGPTETTVWSTRAPIEPGTEAPSIGWPVLQTELRVVKEDGRLAAPGEMGELYIGGAGLARGYRGRPDLTVERFVLRDGERLYRTGDLVRRRPDGALDCLGRTDHQVKVRGFRVELGEVEAALSACEGVALAAVVARTEAGEAELVGYVTGQGERRLDPVGLRRALVERLPRYMVPSRLVQLPDMPLTPNGKVDRRALAAPAAPPPLEAANEDVPRTDTEKRLAAIWREILGVEDVSPHDNFFDLGGYSLLILKLFRGIEAEWGRSLTMADLFAAADLAAMAALLDAAPQDGGRSALITLQPEGERAPLVWFDVGPQLMPLARSLAPHQPFVGLNLEGAAADALARSRPDVAAVAEAAIALLKEVQPNGPYYLGGWCRWGAVAFEAARRLQAGGEEVRLLVMLDAVNNASTYQGLKRRAQAAWSVARGRPNRPAGPKLPHVLTAQVEAASLRYRPLPYPGDVLLLASRDGEPDLDGCSGWREVVQGELSVYRAPSDHSGVLKTPHVEAVGQVLAAALARAQNRPASA